MSRALEKHAGSKKSPTATCLPYRLGPVEPPKHGAKISEAQEARLAWRFKHGGSSASTTKPFATQDNAHQAPGSVELEMLDIGDELDHSCAFAKNPVGQSMVENNSYYLQHPDLPIGKARLKYFYVKRRQHAFRKINPLHANQDAIAGKPGDCAVYAELNRQAKYYTTVEVGGIPGTMSLINGAVSWVPKDGDKHDLNFNLDELKKITLQLDVHSEIRQRTFGTHTILIIRVGRTMEGSEFLDYDSVSFIMADPDDAQHMISKISWLHKQQVEASHDVIAKNLAYAEEAVEVYDEKKLSEGYSSEDDSAAEDKPVSKWDTLDCLHKTMTGQYKQDFVYHGPGDAVNRERYSYGPLKLWQVPRPKVKTMEEEMAEEDDSEYYPSDGEYESEAGDEFDVASNE